MKLTHFVAFLVLKKKTKASKKVNINNGLPE
jgi:hypothetical protein